MSANLNIDQMASNQDQKEVTHNDANGQLDAAMTESVSIAIDNTNAVTLTASQWTRQLMFTFTDSGTTAACTATVPATARGVFIVVNSCGQTLDVEISGQPGAVPQIPDGDTAILACNGTDVFSIGAIGGDGSVDALSWKESVIVATDAAGTLSTDFENGDTVDGVALVTGDRILIKDQATGAENGVYTVNASGAPTRATDFDADAEVNGGAAVVAAEGTANADTIFILTTNDPIVVGTTALVFTALTTGGTTLVDWKDSVRVTTTANGTLSTAYEDGDTIDGVTLATGDRILLKDQTTGSENGIYTVNVSGAPTRATDFDEDAEVTSGAVCYVEEGTENQKTMQFLTTSGAITVGTTALTFEGVAVGPETIEVGGFVGGVPSVSTTVLRYLAADDVDYLADLAGSVGHAGTGPSAQTDFDVQVNGVSKGTMRFASAATTATFLTNPAFSLASGDRLDIITPANLNSLADLSYTFTGTRG